MQTGKWGWGEHSGVGRLCPALRSPEFGPQHYVAREALKDATAWESHSPQNGAKGE